MPRTPPTLLQTTRKATFIHTSGMNFTHDQSMDFGLTTKLEICRRLFWPGWISLL